MVKRRVEFSTVDYENFTGSKPKGAGCWAFAMKPFPDQEDIFWTPPGTKYPAAKRLARKHFPEATTLWLLPVATSTYLRKMRDLLQGDPATNLREVIPSPVQKACAVHFLEIALNQAMTNAIKMAENEEDTYA